MNGPDETKSEIRARLDEVRQSLSGAEDGDTRAVYLRIGELERKLNAAEEDMYTSIVKSHKALCEVKKMGEREAYGHDPAVYYCLGVCGEAGEMANAIVKAMRNPVDRNRMVKAIMGELPDVIIYSYVLAYVLDIDLTKLVNEKAEVVVERALAGYYGGPLPRTRRRWSRRVRGRRQVRVSGAGP